MNLEYLIHSALHNKAPLKDFRIYLRCGIQLSRVNQAFGENFAETIAELLVENTGEHVKIYLFEVKILMF